MSNIPAREAGDARKGWQTPAAYKRLPAEAAPAGRSATRKGYRLPPMEAEPVVRVATVAQRGQRVLGIPF
ncbi:hypothetical protein B296_00014561 [Ensete ventricosum]|uniref:Uncharacterized protein n=1 Tax=Ensete ventricosum TaxID=4639 RepID=A0A426YE38_ENSVE|nr:hypothetical protein B296_00014561 [Ensete ventricosum]